MTYTNNNTNENLKQLSSETLIIGVDIAKLEHVAKAIDYRGIELSKSIKFNSTMRGFREFLDWIYILQETHNKSTVIVGLEPTGPYGHTLTQFLRNCDIHTVLVLGKQVNTAKELDDNTPSKNDSKDALIIAKLVKDGRYRKLRTFTEEVASLKEAMAHDRQLTKDLTRIKCRIDNWLCQYFPEFKTAFKSWTFKTAFITLKCFPMPKDIAKLTPTEISTVWRENGVQKGIGVKKAEQLIFLARHSAGLTSASEFAENHIRCMIEQYILLTEQKDELWAMTEMLLKDIPLYQTLIKIPCMSKRIACGIASEIGDVSDFSHSKQLIRLAGLSLKEVSSGKKHGLTEISRRGRPHLRHWLYLAVLELLKRREFSFWHMHNHYKNRKINPLKPMQSVIALCNKLLRVIFGMATNEKPYDSRIVTSGLPGFAAA